MEDTLITFETAELAKEKGFNIPCKHLYDIKTGEYSDGYIFGDVILAPTQSLLQKWLRDKYNWHWNKVKPSSFFNAKNAPMKKFEDVVVFSKGKIANGSKNMMKYNPQGLVECGKIRPPKNDSVPNQSTIGKRPSRANSYKQDFTNYPIDLIEFSFEQKPLHPTQKPKELMKYFISTYTDENDVVLDNTMGSGTTCLASKELNRFFVGIEKEKQYYEIAVSRVCGS